MRRGIIAEYADADALIVAIHVARSRGLTALDAFTPISVHGLDDALGARRSPLSLAAGLGAALGAAGGYFLQWVLLAYLYPIDAGAHPPHMPLAFLIITIEMGFLGGGVTVFFACLFAARLFKLWEPMCEVPGIESITRDGYWLAVDAGDPKWDGREIEALLRGTGPRSLHGFGGLG